MRPMASVVLIGVLTAASSSFAAVCEKQLLNPPGSFIEVTWTPWTTDPDEQFENDEVILLYAGSRFLALSSGIWNVPQNFRFTADSGNLLLHAEGASLDDDEGCDLFAAVNNRPAFTPQQKSLASQHVTQWGLVTAGALAMTAAIGCSSPVGPICIGFWALAGALGANTLIMRDVAGDPPEQNGAVAQPVFGSMPKLDNLGFSSQMKSVLKLVLGAAVNAVAYSNAAVTNANRAAGDSESGADPSAHIAAAKQQLAQLGAVLLQSRDALVKAQQVFSGIYQGVPNDLNTVLPTVRARLSHPSDPGRAYLVATWKGLGLSDEQINVTLRSILFAQWPAPGSAIYPTGSIPAPARTFPALLSAMIDSLDDVAVTFQQ